MREIEDAGVSERELHIEYASTHEAVIERAFSKKCDFGFVRTAELERYCGVKHVSLSTFRVFAAREPSPRAFPYGASTR